jgi:hypothetical protein
MSFKKYLEEDYIREESIDSKFITKLVNYLDSLFPSHGEFSDKMGAELKKYVKMGDEESYKEFKKLKNKVHDAFLKSKQKFLTDLQNRIERININTKKEVDDKVTLPQPEIEKLPVQKLPDSSKIENEESFDNGY